MPEHGDFGVQDAERRLSTRRREHGMPLRVHGMALSGAFVPRATFIVFSDYMKPRYWLAALLKLPVTTCSPTTHFVGETPADPRPRR
jgi:transketolase